MPSRKPIWAAVLAITTCSAKTASCCWMAWFFPIGLAELRSRSRKIDSHPRHRFGKPRRSPLARTSAASGRRPPGGPRDLGERCRIGLPQRGCEPGWRCRPELERRAAQIGQHQLGGTGIDQRQLPGGGMGRDAAREGPRRPVDEAVTSRIGASIRSAPARPSKARAIIVSPDGRRDQVAAEQLQEPAGDRRRKIGAARRLRRQHVKKAGRLKRRPKIRRSGAPASDVGAARRAAPHPPATFRMDRQSPQSSISAAPAHARSSRAISPACRRAARRSGQPA